MQHQPKLLRCRTPRRGFPCPLRAAFVVLNDLDGLRLRSPCDLFQPLTPMGLGSRLPAPCPFTSVRGRTLPDAGGRWCPLERLPVGALAPRLSPRRVRAAAAVASDRSGSGSPIRSPRPASAAGFVSVRRRALDHRLAASPRGLPRPATPALTVARWLRPRCGVSSPVCLDPRPRVTAAQGRPTGNGPCRRRPGPPCAPGPARSRVPDRSRLPASRDHLARFCSPLARALRRSVGRAAGYEDSLLTCERASTFEKQSRTWDGDRQRRIPRGLEEWKKGRIQGRLEMFFFSKTTTGEQTR